MCHLPVVCARTKRSDILPGSRHLAVVPTPIVSVAETATKTQTQRKTYHLKDSGQCTQATNKTLGAASPERSPQLVCHMIPSPTDEGRGHFESRASWFLWVVGRSVAGQSPPTHNNRAQTARLTQQARRVDSAKPSNGICKPLASVVYLRFLRNCGCVEHVNKLEARHFQSRQQLVECGRRSDQIRPDFHLLFAQENRLRDKRETKQKCQLLRRGRIKILRLKVFQGVHYRSTNRNSSEDKNRNANEWDQLASSALVTWRL